MGDESIRQELFLLVGYLLTSAHGLYDEPAGYGPFRLMDATGRLLEIMAGQSWSDPFLRQLQAALEAERFGVKGDQELRDRLNELCLQYSAELKQRLARSPSDQAISEQPAQAGEEDRK